MAVGVDGHLNLHVVGYLWNQEPRPSGAMIHTIVVPTEEDREYRTEVVMATNGRYYLIPKVWAQKAYRPLAGTEWIPISDVDAVRIIHTRTLLVLQMPSGRTVH